MSFHGRRMQKARKMAAVMPSEVTMAATMDVDATCACQHSRAAGQCLAYLTAKRILHEVEELVAQALPFSREHAPRGRGHCGDLCVIQKCVEEAASVVSVGRCAWEM